jgi:hypothetical protein
MSRNHIRLFVVVFIGVFTTTAAQVVCVNPIVIGELRVMRGNLCVNIAGYKGLGSVNTFACDGFDDQQIIMCTDGTIRNTKSPNNCFTPGRDGKGIVKSSTCLVLPSLPDYQKWRFGESKTFFDSFGIEQEAKQIINVESEWCLHAVDFFGTSIMITSDCVGYTDQNFYFRSRGQLLSHGRLQVQKSGLCLGLKSKTSGPHLVNNVGIKECGNIADQYFGFYENGEIVNKKSRLCLNVVDFTGRGNVNMYACDYFDDQRWYRPTQFCHGDYCSLVNKMSGECLNVVGTEATSNSNVNTHTCNLEQDQRFKFVTGTWVSPTASWSLVGCNENGVVTQTISNTIGYSKTISESTAIEIGAEIEAGYAFGSVTVSTTVSQSLSVEWTESQETSKEITFACEFYDNGQQFEGGCMWQLKLTTEQTTNADDELVWTPQIVRCTSDHTAPTCPPFTRCQDKACKMCEGTFFGKKFGKKKRKHSAKRSFWKKVSKTHK